MSPLTSERFAPVGSVPLPATALAVATAPFVSVVVPTYKRPELLERCIEALRAQTYDRNHYEVVVADDGASSEVEERVEAWNRTPAGTVAKPRIRYVAVRGRHGPAAARNRGWQAARGEIIAFTDDDCIPHRDWVKEGAAACRNGLVAAWGELVMPLPAEPTDYQRDASRLAQAEFVTANCFCRKDSLRAIGGFDENFTHAWREDSDLYFRLLTQGRIAPAPGAQVLHPIRPVPWGVSVSQQSKVYFDALLFKKHPERFRKKIGASRPWLYYAIVASGVAAVVLLATGQRAWAATAATSWFGLTLYFCFKRLRNTTRRVSHIAEMFVTSVLIPPVALFWRWLGAIRFRVWFW